MIIIPNTKIISLKMQYSMKVREKKKKKKPNHKNKNLETFNTRLHHARTKPKAIHGCSTCLSLCFENKSGLKPSWQEQ